MPQDGPRIVFLSGGTAINGLAKVLSGYTHNATYLVTTFDSGGSSAALRQVFNMPAVGDLRSRLVALHGDSEQAISVAGLLGYRIPKSYSLKQAEQVFRACLDETFAPLVAVPESIRLHCLNYLQVFASEIRADFPWAGASIGNLVMAGMYLAHQRDIHYVVNTLKRWLEVKADVLPITDANAHLQSELENGQIILGQHAITGKEVQPIQSKVVNIRLVCDEAKLGLDQRLSAQSLAALASADLICYPPGSFYSSLIANLLPKGVVQAIAANPCAKVYIPNLGSDPEQFALDFDQQLHTLLNYLGVDQAATDQVLNGIVFDATHLAINTKTQSWLLQQGVQLCHLESSGQNPTLTYDNQLLAKTLCSLI